MGWTFEYPHGAVPEDSFGAEKLPLSEVTGEFGVQYPRPCPLVESGLGRRYRSFRDGQSLQPPRDLVEDGWVYRDPWLGSRFVEPTHSDPPLSGSSPGQIPERPKGIGHASSNNQEIEMIK